MSVSENAILWFCILVAALGVLALSGILYFGLVLTRHWLWKRQPGPDLFDWLFHQMPPDRRYADQVARYLSEAYTEHLQRRNEFWTTYGQVVIATLIIVVLSILLLTKTISAEAGLPILSGVSGFAIAKGVAMGRGPTQGPGRQGE
jgi:hypothetical protein